MSSVPLSLAPGTFYFDVLTADPRFTGQKQAGGEQPVSEAGPKLPLLPVTFPGENVPRHHGSEWLEAWGCRQQGTPTPS